jgi:sugar diacid utilization regulator
MLTDSTHHLVAHAGWDENLDEPQWQHYLKHGYIANEFALAVSNDLEFRRKMISDIVAPVVIHYREIFRHPQMVSRVYAKGINLAYLNVLAAYRPFRETDFELATIICDIILIMMQQAQDKLVVANTEIESLLIDILKNGPEQKDVDERLGSHKLSFSDEICLFCLDAGEIFDSTEKMFFVKSLMQNFFIGGISFIYNGRVLVIAEYKNNNKLILTADKISSLASLLQTHDLTCGVSRPFANLKDIKLHYEQALQALKTAQHLKHPGPIYFYEDYFLYYLVATMLQNDDLRNICHPGLLELIARDKEKNSSYATSLYLYLQHNGDVTATAQAMHVHYNTLKYRLQKIAESLEADITDYSTLLKCKITFLALELYHKISFTEYFDKVSIPEETPYLL